ncbi:hypothetical protein [Rhodococcoides kyotonense]|uniref:Uncharacterized protein n=1 Tax=Rhodococcoides kyotonense TaxID=398843 RepID=A0A177YER7_9NOCA|nr:hypothetical protein [Rhodococcus kyotonensis]OAK53820.1 hypothetical protein A3K89_22130 [Rhodococcus kyotonensis]
MSLTPTVDKNTVIARARAAIENRTKYIESLFDAAQAADAAREKVADATRIAEHAHAEHAAAYKDAIEAGWTAAELTESGLAAPPTPAGKKSSRGSAKRTSSRGTPRRRVGAEHSPNQSPTGNSAASDEPASPPSSQPVS